MFQKKGLWVWEAAGSTLLESLQAVSHQTVGSYRARSFQAGPREQQRRHSPLTEVGKGEFEKETNRAAPTADPKEKESSIHSALIPWPQDPLLCPLRWEWSSLPPHPWLCPPLPPHSRGRPHPLSGGGGGVQPLDGLLRVREAMHYLSGSQNTSRGRQRAQRTTLDRAAYLEVLPPTWRCHC